GIIVVGSFYALNRIFKREQNLYVKARNDYVKNRFASAADSLKQLIADFPRSDNVPQYQFLLDLSEVRDQVYSADANPRQALVRMRRFLEAYKETAALQDKEYVKDIRLTLFKLSELLTAQAEQGSDRSLLEEARGALADSVRYRTQDSTADEEQTYQQQ